MAPKYKLSFFPIRARGEVPRLLFAVAKVDYEYIEIPFSEWPNLKPETPFGGLPLLEIDDEKHGQQMAICSYLAREFGLMGSSQKDAFLIEQLHHAREDLFMAEAKLFIEKDAEAKVKINKNLEEEVYPRHLGNFCKFLKRNNGGKGFVVGDKLSLADLVLYESLTTALKNSPAVVKKFPELVAHRERIGKIDSIKQHVATLADTPI